MTKRQIVVPAGWEAAYEFGYAPAVRVGDQVIVSGVPAAGPGTYEDQVERMYARIGTVLEAAGAAFDDVVELVSYHVGPTDPASFGDEVGRLMPIHRRYFGEHRPAWTAVGTSALLAPGASVEMKVVAVIGSGADSAVVPRAEDADADPSS